ncbi:MAG: ABC transporter permease subunit [Solirubrobacterales bacterium]|nr:ABC transporter permease subunit [Solirubrobacterales bacterium]
MSSTAASLLPPKPAVSRRRRWGWRLALLVLVGVLVFSWFDTGASIPALINGLFAKNGLFSWAIPSSVPPAGGVLWQSVKAAVTTLAIAALSIVLGGVLSLLVLPLSARNIAPGRLVYELTRLILAVLRSIPELIMLLMFNVVMGFSPFSSVLALTLHGLGVKGKLFAEAVEEMDMTPVDALHVAGAGRIQTFLHAVLPGVRSTLTGLTLYRLDSNFRSAVTLGAVGGGGIGQLIDSSLQTYQFKQVTTYIIVLVVAVMLIERLSTILRRQLGQR